MADIFTAPLNDLEFKDIGAFAASVPSPHESERLDFKVQWSASVTQSIVAMANQNGGVILIGIAEHNPGGQPKSLKWPSPGIAIANALDQLASTCHAIIRPNYVPDAKVIPFPGDETRGFLLIRIRPEKCPRPLWHEEKGILYRVGDQNRPADLDTIRRLLLEPRRNSEGDRVYSEWAGHAMNANGGERYWLSVTAQFSQEAQVFDSDEKLRLVQAILDHHGLNAGAGELSATRNEVSISFPRGRSTRDFSARFSRTGVAVIQFSGGDSTFVPLAWILDGISHSLKGLFDPRVTEVFGNGDLNVTVSLSNWPANGISTQGLMELRLPSTRNHSGYSMHDTYLLSAGENHKDVLLSFANAVLADSGYLGFEGKTRLLIGSGAYRW